MTPVRSQGATAVEAAIVVLMCFGWFIYASFSVVAAGFPTQPSANAAVFSDSTLFGTALMEILLGGVALVFLRWRGQSPSSVLPRPTWQGGLTGVMLCFVTLMAWWLLASFFSRSEYAEQPIAQMLTRSVLSMPVVVLFSLVNGVYEETFVLGYLMRSFEHQGASLAIGISVLVRLMYHLYQGPIGALSACMFGMVMGLYYWRSRALWPAAFAHVLADMLALT